MKPRWRIYYGDGSTYSDLDGPPEMAPGLNVQVIVQRNQNLPLISGGLPVLVNDGDAIDPSKKGFYCYGLSDPDFWTATDYHGFIDYLQLPGWKTVKFGRTIDAPTWQNILQKAATDPDFE